LNGTLENHAKESPLATPPADTVILRNFIIFNAKERPAPYALRLFTSTEVGWALYPGAVRPAIFSLPVQLRERCESGGVAIIRGQAGDHNEAFTSST
jgi:hypothetical protein